MSGANLGAPGDISSPQISPDGRHVVVDGTKDLWLYDTLRGNPSRFTINGAGDNSGMWSPDAARIVFASLRSGKVGDLYVKTAGASADELLLASDVDKRPEDWSRDGRVIVFNAWVDNQFDRWWLPLYGDRKPVPYLQTGFNEVLARLSPDGRWLAYVSDDTGRSEIYVDSFPTPGGKVLISTNGGYQPTRRRDGKELYYLTPDRKLMTVAVKLNATFEFGELKLLFQTCTPPRSLSNSHNHYAATADGEKISGDERAGGSVRSAPGRCAELGFRNRQALSPT